MFNRTASTGGIAQIQFHANAPTAIEDVSSTPNIKRGSAALMAVLSWIRHG